MPTTTNKKKSVSNPNSSLSTKIFRDFSGLCFLFAALFSFLSLFSYSSSDPSWFTVSSKLAKNLGGLIGSHWSAALLQFFGAASYVLAGIFLLAGVALFRKITSKEWLYANASYLLLMITASACFGLVQKPLHIGGGSLPMGGLIGLQLGGLLHSYLNTVGAAMLTSFLLIFSVSLSIRMSVKDLALYAWLALSKTAVYISTVALFLGMHLWSALHQTYLAIIPILKDCVDAIQEQFKILREVKMGDHKETICTKPEIKIGGPQLVGTNAAVSAIPMEIAPPASASFSSSGTEPVISQRINSSTMDAIDVLPPEENPSSEGLGKGAKIVNFMKKAVRENEKTVKTALGKKIQYELPPLSFLPNPSGEETKIDREELLKNSRLLEEKLADFKVTGNVVAVKPGPVVTMYEFKPGPGVKVNSIANLSDDLALALAAKSVRIVAPIPGRDVVGIEIPNAKTEAVLLKEILATESFLSKKHSIPIAIGKDILGEPVVTDLKKMPHLLVAGTTGSGKSVFINALICSLLYRFTPDELRMIMVDPKQIELSLYNDIPHLLLPVVSESKKASLALRWAVDEMERRYKLIAKTGMRDIEGYNQKLVSIGEEAMRELINQSKESFEIQEEISQMPKLVVIIDELADLMAVSKSDVENNIQRLAQKARAAGIHLVLATQRPSVDVITGTIKANLPARISFRVSSKTDSRTIFDSMGAERLVGKGDMLFLPPGESTLVRLHGAFLDTPEVQLITDFWRNQAKPDYREDILVDPEEDEAWADGGEANSFDDPLYKEALELVTNSGFASASMLQRRLRVGYNRAARMVETMEARGIVGPAEGSKPRPVIARL